MANFLSLAKPEMTGMETGGSDSALVIHRWEKRGLRIQGISWKSADDPAKILYFFFL